MTDLWQLPVQTVIGGRRYDLHTDFRDILEIMQYLEDPDKPEYLRWMIAVALFYEQSIPTQQLPQAMQYLAEFISGGSTAPASTGKLMDWQQDAAMIVADINKIAGQEIRSLPYLHWWTFLGYFHAIGSGQFSTAVAIRSKLQKGEKLTDWEKTYYRENKHRVDLPKRYSRQEKAQIDALKQLLGS